MTIKQIAIQVGICSDLSDLLPCLMYWIVGRPERYRMLFIFLAILSICKILTIATAMLSINNMPLYHLLSFTELILVFLFYETLLELKNKNAFYLSLAILVIYNVIDTLFVEGINNFNSISWSINTAVLILLGFLYFYHLYKNSINIFIEQHPDYYFNSAFLIYASGSLFTYLLAWKILSEPARNFFHSGWIVHSVANITKSVVITYGLWLVPRD